MGTAPIIIAAATAAGAWLVITEVTDLDRPVAIAVAAVTALVAIFVSRDRS